MSEDLCPLAEAQQEVWNPRLCSLESNKGGNCPYINYSNYRKCQLYLEWLAKRRREENENKSEVTTDG